MKKIILIILLVLMCGCDKKTYISRNLKINIDKCKIEKEIDTHGGFLGDGEYYAKINCSNTDIKIKKWNKLPLSNDLEKLMNNSMCDSKKCMNAYERYNIPKIEDGYYYFLDRQKSDEDINSRYSYNYSIGLYDTKNKIIYYYELDT